MVKDFLEKHQTFAKITYLIIGLFFLYLSIKYGLLGLLTGQTQLLDRHQPITQITSFWAYPVSLFTLIIGGFVTIVCLSWVFSESFRVKFLQNRIIQILFLIALAGYIILYFHLGFN